MSLDVYLNMKNPVPVVGNRIFIREDGSTKEISREEWDKRYPGIEPVAVECNDTCVYSASITHNLNTMAGEAGIYEALWRPEEISITKAVQLIGPLEEGLSLLLSDRAKFEAFNPKNGWGNYDSLVKFIYYYLNACKMYPDSEVEVSR